MTFNPITTLKLIYIYRQSSVPFKTWSSVKGSQIYTSFSSSSYHTGGCLLSLVWQHSILVVYMHHDCHIEAKSYMYNIGH